MSTVEDMNWTRVGDLWLDLATVAAFRDESSSMGPELTVVFKTDYEMALNSTDSAAWLTWLADHGYDARTLPSVAEFKKTAP